MKLVDSHCHLDLIDPASSAGDVAATVAHAREQGVCHMLCVAISTDTVARMLRLVEPYDDVSISVGMHPNERQAVEPEVGDLVRLAGLPKVVAIGETGLDYFRCDGDLGWQQERFRRHISAAKETGKPLIVHSRDARNDTLRILREEKAGEAGGVMHCFTGNWATARRLLDIDFYISFSGIVTFNSARELREVAERMPLERMLIETDSPYLAPVPHRGRTNRPGYVRHVAECIAALRGESVDTIAEATTANFARLFAVDLQLDSHPTLA